MWKNPQICRGAPSRAPIASTSACGWTVPGICAESSPNQIFRALVSLPAEHKGCKKRHFGWAASFFIMRLHLAFSAFCAPWSAGRSAAQTKQPTTAPVPTPAPAQTAPESTHATLLYENASCEGSDQGAYLGTPASVDECAASAAAAGCDMFMFSESYGYAWGCRCCSAKTQYHDNWSIYSVDSKNSQRTTPRPTTAPTPTVTDANGRRPTGPPGERDRGARRPWSARPSINSCQPVSGTIRRLPRSGPAGARGPTSRSVGPITTASLTLTWRDYWGNNKGALQITGCHQVVHCYDNDGGDYWKTRRRRDRRRGRPEIIPSTGSAPTAASRPHQGRNRGRSSAAAADAIVHRHHAIRPCVAQSGARAAGRHRGVAGVPMEAVRITNIQTVQRRHLRRRLEASTVVVDYEIEARFGGRRPQARRDKSSAEFDAVIQDAAEAAGAGAAFADVRTEEISVASAESEEEEEDDDASTSKFASVKFIASVAAGCFCLAAALAVRWASSIGAGRRRRPGSSSSTRACGIRAARCVGTALVAPLAPEPPMASIKERALAEAARAAGEHRSTAHGASIAGARSPGGRVPRR